MRTDDRDVDYAETILEHFESSPFRGDLTDASATADGQNPGCSDWIRVALMIDDSGVITTARFTGEGCTISLAGASIACEAAEGRRVHDVLTMDREVMETAIGVGAVASRPRCAMLGLATVKDAVTRWLNP